MCVEKCSEPSSPAIEANEGATSLAGTDDLPTIADGKALPIIFVHGFLGSAQQFSSQAMRYVANGYPGERLRVFEHEGVGTDIDEFASDLGAMIDEVRTTFDREQVYLIAHSRGTAVSATYLSEAAQAAKVAKYIALDGGDCAMVPVIVPCISPSQGSGDGTHPLPGQRHFEVATSKESFAVQWEFLFGEAPEVVDIVKQRRPVEIAGRALNFPANTGAAGAALSIWAIEQDTGRRLTDAPLVHAQIDASGDWGPVVVDPDASYELMLDAQDGRIHHFYPQRFLRSDQFVRLLSGPAASEIHANTNVGEWHSALAVVRMREWTQEDVLRVGTQIEGSEQETDNVVTRDVGEGALMIHLHDDATTPRETTLAPLSWFNDQPFQAGVDVYMPASDPPSGTITLTNLPRGDAAQPQTIHIPNWNSKEHEVTVVFSDSPQPLPDAMP